MRLKLALPWNSKLIRSAQPSLSSCPMLFYSMLHSTTLCTAIMVLVIIKLSWIEIYKITNQLEITEIVWLVTRTGEFFLEANTSALLPVLFYDSDSDSTSPHVDKFWNIFLWKKYLGKVTYYIVRISCCWWFFFTLISVPQMPLP